MANLYGSMMGTRAAGLVGKEEMTAQVQTWKGMVRVWSNKDGEFEVYVADNEGENGMLLIQGNMNTRQATDADKEPFTAAELATTLDPIPVKNRGKGYTQKSGITPAPVPQTVGTLRKPNIKRQVASTGPMPSQQTKAQQQRTAARLAFKVEDFSVGDTVKLVEDPQGNLVAYGIGIGTEGFIETIKVKSALGPQVMVNFGPQGAAPIFPKLGDKIEAA